MWWLLILLSVVGAYLLWYTKRRHTMLETFVQAHGLTIRPELASSIQQTLDLYFSLEDPGVVRSFCQLAGIVDGDTVRLFRAIELLDLSPHSSASSTHFSRIAALFEVSTEYDDFFLLDASLKPTRRWSGSPKPDPRAVTLAKKAATASSPRHTLSITLTHGHGLIYFEPLITAGETQGDLDCLYEIARQMHYHLSEPKIHFRVVQE